MPELVLLGTIAMIRGMGINDRDYMKQAQTGRPIPATEGRRVPAAPAWQRLKFRLWLLIRKITGRSP